MIHFQALGLTPQQMSKLNSSQHRRVVSSPEHYHQREPSDPIGMHCFDKTFLVETHSDELVLIYR